jgi:hypothetical protein
MDKSFLCPVAGTAPLLPTRSGTDSERGTNNPVHPHVHLIWVTSIWRLECSNRLKIRLPQKCYPSLRCVVSPMCPGRTLI